jgi:hypothetical protein
MMIRQDTTCTFAGVPISFFTPTKDELRGPLNIAGLLERLGPWSGKVQGVSRAVDSRTDVKISKRTAVYDRDTESFTLPCRSGRYS